MRYLHFMLAAAFLAAACINTAVADPNQGQTNPRPPLGNNPYPVIWGAQQSKPAQPVGQPPAGRPADNARHGHPHQGAGQAYYFFRGYSPYVAGAYAYDPYYGGYGYPYAYSSLYSPYPPPLYLPPDELFGPRAVWRFLGIDDRSRLVPNANIIPPPARDDNLEAPEPKKGAQRATNAQAVARAWKFIRFGDARFAQQKYSEANQRYRTASESAPQLADAWFRQAFALLALGRYQQALGAIKRGLRINPNWARSDFNLKQLYADDEMAKNAHRDALAEAAEANPNDADLLFLLGIHLHFDAQADRAQKFFDRAKQLAGDDPQQELRTFTPSKAL
jgi:tetratricopeptide (TPR) repeat protein